MYAHYLVADAQRATMYIHIGTNTQILLSLLYTHKSRLQAGKILYQCVSKPTKYLAWQKMRRRPRPTSRPQSRAKIPSKGRFKANNIALRRTAATKCALLVRREARHSSMYHVTSDRLQRRIFHGGFLGTVEAP